MRCTSCRRARPSRLTVLPPSKATLLCCHALQGDAAAMEGHLATISAGLQQCQALLSRMGEACDPAVYYARVRTPMCGWRGNPALPDGLVYGGVWQQPQQLYGETGAQSPLLHALDAALGIEHPCGW